MRTLRAPTTTVCIHTHKTRSGLVTGVVQLEAGLASCDLPFHEHSSRNGRLVVQFQEIALDLALLDEICAALGRTEAHLRHMREVFARAAGSLMLSIDADDWN